MFFVGVSRLMDFSTGTANFTPGMIYYLKLLEESYLFASCNSNPLVMKSNDKGVTGEDLLFWR